jgi:transcriptional regulator GlxA family with amidase domain
MVTSPSVFDPSCYLDDERPAPNRQALARILAEIWPGQPAARLAGATGGPPGRPVMAGKVGYSSLQTPGRGREHGAMPPRTVLFLVFDGVQSLDVTGPLEVFAHACDGGGERDGRLQPGGRGDPAAAYRIVVAGPGGVPVRTSAGLTLVPDCDLAAAPAAHTVVVPGGRGTRRGQPDVTAWLRRHGPRAQRLTSVCTGAFLLAEAGLLNGRRVTTHWAYADALARRFPEVTVDPEPIFVRDGPVVTSAGVTAGIDLALALVEEDIGREAALEVARLLVVFLRRPGGQAQFSAQLQAQLARRQPLREVQQWITERPGEDLSVGRLAARAGLSPRQFARTFAAETGVTPGRYVGQVRLEAARRELEDTGEGIEQVARSCGFGTPEAMRRAFVRSLGVSPAGYRQRFQAAAVTPAHLAGQAPRLATPRHASDPKDVPCRSQSCFTNGSRRSMRSGPMRS